jgi:hypothetical protein
MEVNAVASIVLNVAITVLGIVLLASIFGAVVWFIYQQKKYQYVIQLWLPDNNGNIIDEERDKGGIFVDKKTGTKHFWLKKQRKGLRCDEVPYRRVGNKRIVTVLKRTDGVYRIINPKITLDKLKFHVSEEDVNWAIFDYEKYKRKYADDPWAKWMPIAIYAIAVVASLVLVIYLVQKFEVLADLANSLEATAQTMLEIEKAKAGTTVIQ